MTENTNKFAPQINAFLVSKDFDSIFKLFSTGSFSFQDILIFYKRNKREVFKSTKYWKSPLPHFHLREVIESDLKVYFLRSYLESDSNCNPELSEHLIFIAKDDYIKHFKLSEAFEYPDFMGSFNRLSTNDPQLNKVSEELGIITKAKEKIAREETEDDHYLLQFKFGEVMLAFSLYYYKFKQEGAIEDNKSLQTQIEMTLARELDRIITLFKSKSEFNFHFPSNDSLQKSFQRNEAPHRFLGKKGLEIPKVEPTVQLLYNIIDRLIERSIQKGEVQLYLSGYSDFISVILNPAPVRTNASYRTFKINDKKSDPEGLYFTQNIFSSKGIGNISRIDISKSMEVLDWYGIPRIIPYRKSSIQLEKILQLVKCFSVYKGPLERTFYLDLSYKTMNEGDKLFIELFGTNESITLFDYDKLTSGISNYFKWSEPDTELILSFLTLDLESHEFPLTWLSKPFLKLKNQVLWLGTFLKDRRWDNILLNKLKQEKEFKSLVNTLSKNLELKIESLFKDKNFKTKSGLEFKSLNGEKGDFDVLAYKDDYLFVCEVKSGTRNDNFSHAVNSQTKTLEGVASGQLDKAVANIKEDWTSIKSNLQVLENIPIETLKIIPLIITDYFDGDMILYKSHRKISYLELGIILKNKKSELYKLYEDSLDYLDTSNPSLKTRNKAKISNWDLWEGKNELEVETLLRNIDGNMVWKEIEQIWKLEDEEYLISY